MSAAALSARVRRLDQLALGVAREVQLVGQDDFLLYVERREYLTALHRMCAGLEGARVVLAKGQAASAAEALIDYLFLSSSNVGSIRGGPSHSVLPSAATTLISLNRY